MSKKDPLAQLITKLFIVLMRDNMRHGLQQYQIDSLWRSSSKQTRKWMKREGLLPSWKKKGK